MNSKYFCTFGNNEEAKKTKVFVFPYAGGGASAFKDWQRQFAETEIVIVQYPGRENRIKDPPLDNLELLVTEVFHDIRALINDGTPYFLLGHSLGTKVAYELALLIQKNCLPWQPSGVILSAGKAPCCREDNPIHHLDDAGFIKGIGRFAGTPKEILENKALMGVFAPMLRADFKMSEIYHRDTVEKINCPILALMGTEDTELTLEELLLWREYTTAAFTYKSVQGAHLFINTNRTIVIDTIKNFVNT